MIFTRGILPQFTRPLTSSVSVNRGDRDDFRRVTVSLADSILNTIKEGGTVEEVEKLYNQAIRLPHQVRFQESPLIVAIRDRPEISVELLRCLIQRGVSPHKDDTQWPLHEAVKRAHEGAIGVLKWQGVDTEEAIGLLDATPHSNQVKQQLRSILTKDLS